MDHYQVKRYESWYRYVTLAMLALSFLIVTRATLADGDAGLASSANEIRRMAPPPPPPPRTRPPLPLPATTTASAGNDLPEQRELGFRAS